jgi:hypothetical protein
LSSRDIGEIPPEDALRREISSGSAFIESPLLPPFLVLSKNLPLDAGFSQAAWEKIKAA